jgi:hypothetical protein
MTENDDLQDLTEEASEIIRNIQASNEIKEVKDSLILNVLMDIAIQTEIISQPRSDHA